MAARISVWKVCLVLAMMLSVLGCDNDDGLVQEPTASPTPAFQATPDEEPSPAPEPEPEPEAEIYVVESGDTLTSIAPRFDTTVDAIVDANDLDNPDLILVGDEFVIPPAP